MDYGRGRTHGGSENIARKAGTPIRLASLSPSRVIAIGTAFHARLTLTRRL
jgi:hypothetical protein